MEKFKWNEVCSASFKIEEVKARNMKFYCQQSLDFALRPKWVCRLISWQRQVGSRNACKTDASSKQSFHFLVTSAN
jgi:hypothetical protein